MRLERSKYSETRFNRPVVVSESGMPQSMMHGTTFDANTGEGEVTIGLSRFGEGKDGYDYDLSLSRAEAEAMIAMLQNGLEWIDEKRAEWEAR